MNETKKIKMKIETVNIQNKNKVKKLVCKELHNVI